jgi:hypothetical protein
MGRSVLTITTAHLKLGDTSATVAQPAGTAPDFACQVTNAAINSVPNMNTVPASFCAAASSAPGATGWELAITWLQDWDLIPATATVVGSLSEYAFRYDAQAKWFSLSLTAAAPPLVVGQCYIVAGAYGGEAGTPLTADAVWPLLAKPTLTVGVSAVPLLMEFGAEEQQTRSAKKGESVPA